MAPEVVLFHNIGLSDVDTSEQTSNVGEPSVANNGREILATGNWYATRSLDNGVTWDFISPFNFFPPASGGFCCDQVVLYDPSRDRTFWLLQYIEAGNTNTLRLAVKEGATLGNNVWHWWDFQPDQVDNTWTNLWFDYPDLGLSNDYLYMTTNVFTVDGLFDRAAVFRFPLDQLGPGGTLDYDVWSTTQNGSLRCALGARDTMYFASHNRLDQIRVWTWPESAQLSVNDVNVSAWNQGDYVAVGPDNRNWLSRADGRITGAWVGNGLLGFMWTANSRGSRPNPHIRVVLLREDNKQLVSEPDIWSSALTYAYPAACPNDRGHVGITLFRSSSSVPPSHVVGILDDLSSPGWSLQGTRDGTNGPSDEKWGDYLSCRRHSPDGLTWIASGFTLQGGTARRNVEPRVVHFGRPRDARAVERSQGA
jgi:hypothetical protein